MMQIITINTTLQIRQDTYEGRQHLVAPVVILTEGVHSGSGGPLYYPTAELAKFPDAWNGVPVTVPHPHVNGRGVSANSPVVLEQFSVGRLFNVSFGDGKLKGEVWIDPEKCNRISPEVLSYLNSGSQLEVSTGLFTEDVQESGTWNSENYIAVATNFRPDHLALLPGARGACSWEDGCGLRSNQKQGVTMKLNALYLGNEQSMDDRLSAVASAIDMLDTPMNYFYCMAVYDDRVVYRMSPRAEHNPNGTRMTLQRSYTIDANGAVVLGEDVIAVREERSFIPVTNHECGCGKDRHTIHNNSDEEGGDTMPKKDRVAKVNALLSLNAGWTEQHREFLENVEADQFTVIETVSKPAASAPQINSADDVLALAPAGLRERIAAGLKLHDDAKAALIATITGNAKNKFTPEQLAAMDMTSLDAIASLATAPATTNAAPEVPNVADYSGNAGAAPAAIVGNEGKVEVLESPKINWSAENK